MTEYNIFILNCITDLQHIYDTMFHEYYNDNISEEKFNSIKKYYEQLMYELKNLDKGEKYD